MVVIKVINNNTVVSMNQDKREIISYAKCSLGKELSDNIYISLTDHISFAIERYEKGMEFHNALLWEIKRFYNHEYQIGQHAIRHIKKRLKVELPEDEGFYDIIMAQYPKEYKCAEKIGTYIKDEYQMEHTKEEKAYLTVHIRRLAAKHKQS